MEETVPKTRRVKQSPNEEPTVQLMTAITGNTIRDIVRLANELEVSRADVVSLLKDNGQFVLVYYK